MDLALLQKRALVTGSTSGIGAAIAKALAREGATVVINGRSRERAENVKAEIEQIGGRAEVSIGDISRAVDVAMLARDSIGKLGGIDILVNNAGGMNSQAGAVNWFDVPADEWLESYNANAVAAVRLIHLLTPQMRNRGWGRIIQIGSVVASAPSDGTPDYSASKAAMVNLTVGLSKALTRTGITVNSVSPGMINTPAIDEWLRSIGQEQGWGDDREKSVEFALRLFPQTVDRLGQTSDIANVVAFLCSPLADFINGTNIHVDGGVNPSIS